MLTGTEVIVGLLILLAVPVLIGVFWLVRRNRQRRREASELKYGNEIYSRWRRSNANQSD
jgi:hypothetical protein